VVVVLASFFASNFRFVIAVAKHSCCWNVSSIVAHIMCTVYAARGLIVNCELWA